MTREKMINAIVDELDGWDEQTLLQYAKDRMRLDLNATSTAQLEQRLWSSACMDQLPIHRNPC
jgi:hypothetical protein